MNRVLAVLFLAACLVVVGCEEKKKAGIRGRGGGMKIRAANVTIRSVDGTVVEDLTLTIDPTTVRAKRGDQIDWTVTAINNLPDEMITVRAEAVYLAPDAVTMTRSTSANLSIDNTLTGLTFRLYIPNKTGYVWDSLVLDDVSAGNPIYADPDAGDLFLKLDVVALSASAPLVLTYTTEVGAATTLPSGEPITPPPPMPII